ncbi:MAG TPA: DUF333 domain-containing protein [Rhizobiaceae bacterium]|nr:DUF333 domain-containing protein [Rhizobiaceae bacterium]
MRITTAIATLLLAAGASATLADEPPPVGIANPASVYCIEQGGKLEIRKTANGEVGYCHLPDGRIIEEWAFFRSGTTDKTGK